MSGLNFGRRARGVLAWLPAAGSAALISLDTLDDVKPAAWSLANWRLCLIDSFGGGCHAASYSTYGAYVLACIGGHANPEFCGAVVYDYAARTHTRIDASNAGFVDAGGASYALADLSADPDYEVLDASDDPSGVPGPGHPYQLAVALPIGTHGSVLYPARSGVSTNANGALQPYVLDLASGAWAQFAAPANNDQRAGTEACAIHDVARGRVYLIPHRLNNWGNQAYLDTASETWVYDGSFAQPSGDGTGGASGEEARVMEYGPDLLIRNAGPTGGLRYFDRATPNEGWVPLTVSGTLPSGQNAWALHADGNFYSFDGSAAGHVLTRIVPPASPKSGTWTVTTKTLTGAELPARKSNNNPALRSHYTGLQTVPALGILAWHPGADLGVYGLNPSD